MAETRIADIIIPDVWNKYMLEDIVNNSNLIRSGIIVPDPELDVLASSGGNTVNMPFFKDLTGDDEILSDSGSLTVDNITTGQDKARIHFRAKAWGSNDLAAALAGTDPMAAIAHYVANFWAMKEQAVLLSSLTGVFANNAVVGGSGGNDSDLIHTAASESIASRKEWNDAAPTVMNPVAIIDGEQLLGDAQEKFTALMMHSKCYGDLKKQELIDFIQPSGVETRIPTYLGKEVIVNDNCPTRAGDTDGLVYQSFLFGRGAIGRGEGAAKVPVETERQALASNDVLITRRHFIMHPRGIQWGESSIAGASPTNDECKEEAQWERVYKQQNIRIAMVETN